MAGTPARAVRGSSRAFERLYLLLVGLPILGIGLVLVAGTRLSPPAPAPAALGGAAGAPQVPAHGALDLGLLLAQIVVILAASWGVDWILRRLGQPRVVGEMTAGILLGPSLLGLVAPGISGLLFPPASIGFLNALSQVGLLLFMFVVGLELDPAILRGRGHTAVLTSHASITAPFLLGTALALTLYPRFAGGGATFAQFALFMGAAMSVTAFPVLARILVERRLVGTRLGTIAILCAAVDDVSAWCMLPAIAALVHTSSGGTPLWLTAAGAAVFAGGMLTWGRRALEPLAKTFERRRRTTVDLLAVAIGCALVSAWVTERLGIHALFGAFIAGVAMPKSTALTRALLDRMHDLLTVLLLPLFFAFTGLRTQLGLIHGAGLWLVAGAILTVAIAGKLGGSTLAARLSGLPLRESFAVGTLMNTRGLIELVFLNIGLDLGVISPTLFAMMVLMALTTTFMTTPLLTLVWPQAGLQQARAAPSGAIAGGGAGLDPDPAAAPRVAAAGPRD